MFCILSNVDVYRLYHVLLRINSLSEWDILMLNGQYSSYSLHGRHLLSMHPFFYPFFLYILYSILLLLLLLLLLNKELKLKLLSLLISVTARSRAWVFAAWILVS
jgi:hypothetical protein